MEPITKFMIVCLVVILVGFVVGMVYLGVFSSSDSDTLTTIKTTADGAITKTMPVVKSTINKIKVDSMPLIKSTADNIVKVADNIVTTTDNVVTNAMPVIKSTVDNIITNTVPIVNTIGNNITETIAPIIKYPADNIVINMPTPLVMPTPSVPTADNTTMPFFNTSIKEGDPIKCISNLPNGLSEYTIYRYYGDGVLRPYPSPEIASSWDPNWGNPKLIDCKNVKVNAPLPLNKSVKSGDAINCSSNGPVGLPTGIYRYDGRGTMRYYSTPAIAASWDPNWDKPKSVDCDGFLVKPQLEVNTSGAKIGNSIRCNDYNNPGTVYKYLGNGVMRGYPSPEIAASWDPQYGNASMVSCKGFIEEKPFSLNNNGLLGMVNSAALFDY